MVTIRKNVFETNSSSCHSITITDDVAENQNDEVLRACGDEFGWEHDIISTPQKKFSYWCVAALDWLCDLLYKDSKEIDIKNASTEAEKKRLRYVDMPLHKSSITKYDDKIRYIKESIGSYFSSRGVTIIWDGEYEEEKWSFDLSGEQHTSNIDGYIDHQSAPGEDKECRELAELWKDPEALYNFIFGNSYIETDNDNH